MMWYLMIFCSVSRQGKNWQTKERVIPEQRNKKILDAVRAETLRPLTECLDRIDQELLKGAIAGANFSELFFANCKDEELANYIRKLLK